MLPIDKALTAAALLFALPAASFAATDPLEEVVVVAPYGATLSRERIAAAVHSVDAAQIERAQSLDLSDLLNRNLPSVHINHAQNNPLQPDLNFRGFTASPLLGLPQGLAVYQNGVRSNEPFGDTVNWDLIALSAIDSVQMFAGSNPVFGLNTLGGALSIRMKNGFAFQGSAAEAYAGSFERRVISMQHGDNNGLWGYYANVDYFAEDGWRDYSQSNALRLFGALSLRSDAGSIDASAAHVGSELRGNGASPVELLELDREQVFTHPDLTENQAWQLALEGSLNLSSALTLGGNAYIRTLDTDTFNGDGSIFEKCDLGGAEFLVEEFDDQNEDGECVATEDDDIVLVRDARGSPIEAQLDTEELNAINNIGRREQQSHGASLQLTWDKDLAGRRNDLLVGVALNRGETSFVSNVEVAYLLSNRAASRTGIYADELRTAVGSELATYSFYFSDTLDVTDELAITLAGRYDRTRVELADRSGASPELNGKHGFQGFNPSLGATYRATPETMLYANVSESMRAPTPVELACASENAPCSLPNAFLADPPLEEVVARNIELGARGRVGALQWQLAAFDTVNDNDILFQTTGGAQANVGFFDNVSDTRRTGIELGLSHRLSRLQWFMQYSLLEAKFEDDFIVNSPNHPLLELDEEAQQMVGAEKFLVTRGSTIPGAPKHQLNAGLDFDLNHRWSFGADATVRSGVYLRGDEINALRRTDGYAVVNLRGQFRLNDVVHLFARIENVFDEQYDTFGLLGEPQEIFEDFEDPRFYGSGPPRGAWLGARARW